IISDVAGFSESKVSVLCADVVAVVMLASAAVPGFVAIVMPALMAVKSGIPQCCVPVNHRAPARRYRWVGKASDRDEPGSPVAGSAQGGVDLRWLREAVELSKRCPPSDAAFSVGAILVGARGQLGGDGRDGWDGRDGGDGRDGRGGGDG